MSGRWWLRTHKNIHCLLFTIKPYDFHRFHSEKVDIEAGKKIHLTSAEILLLLYATVFLPRFKTFQFTSKRNDSKINSVLQHSKVYDTFHFEHGIWLLDEGINCVEFKFISAQLHMALLIFFPLQKYQKSIILSWFLS